MGKEINTKNNSRSLKKRLFPPPRKTRECYHAGKGGEKGRSGGGERGKMSSEFHQVARPSSWCLPSLPEQPLAERSFSRGAEQAAAAPTSHQLRGAWTFQAALGGKAGSAAWRQELLLGMFCIPLPGSGQVASSKKEGTAASKKEKKKEKKN